MKDQISTFSKMFLLFLAILAIVGGAYYFLNAKNMEKRIDLDTGLLRSSQGQELENSGNLFRAYFAGGCFWCMEGIFESESGVTEAIAGYAGGTEADASYEKVGAGITRHREAVEVVYDPNTISYDRLVELYFTQIDPTQADGQFADRGYQYTTAIYTQNANEKKSAATFIQNLDMSKKFDKPVAVKVEDFTTFFPAEDYHQNYYKTSSFKYSLYKKGSGREGYIERTWGSELEKLKEKNAVSGSGNSDLPGTQDGGKAGKIPKELLKEKLTPIQYKVTQEEGTEQPFDNPYWDNKRAGIYVDIIDGTPLYSSLDKYDSGTGWPSFTKPIDPANIRFEEDSTFWSTRIEVRSKNADSHLGHVFDDGPSDRGGKRYCMNSASMRFIPLEDLEREGYGEWRALFEKK